MVGYKNALAGMAMNEWKPEIIKWINYIITLFINILLRKCR